jgi:hypothetical protein
MAKLNEDFSDFLTYFRQDRGVPLDDPRQTFGVTGGLRDLSITVERLKALSDTIRRQPPLPDDRDYIPIYRRIFYVFHMMLAAQSRFSGDYERLGLIGECLEGLARVVGETKS